MAINFHSYSVKRKAILQQVKRLEKRGYTVPEMYKLPTVKELKSMPSAERSTYVRRASQVKTESVRKASYKREVTRTKAGKPVYHKVEYKKARKHERSISSQRGWQTRVKRQREETEKVFKQTQDDYKYKQTLSRKEEEPDLSDYDIDIPREQEQPSPVDETFEEWAFHFIDDAPLDDKANAEAYVQEVREGRDVGSYEEYLESLGEEPTARETFDMKLQNLDQVSPEVADYMRTFYSQIESQVGKAELNRRFSNADEIPDFDTPYETRTGGTSVGYGGVAKMLTIIKGRPLSGSQARKLAMAMERDQQE